jgi:hypothetical protein
MSVGPIGLPAYAGSFDFVRLAPHFGQDDRTKKNETTYCHQSGAEAAEGSDATSFFGAVRTLVLERFSAVLIPPIFPLT